MIFNIPRLMELLQMCRAQYEAKKLRIIAGGRAFRRAPDLYKEVGADGFAAELREACALLRGWSAN